MTNTINAREVRRLVLHAAHRAGVGHIGSALSVVEILCTLYKGVLRVPSVDDPERDRFVMSKGHAALALYAVLALAGHLPHEFLERYCQEGGQLGTHPSCILPGVDFSTGSLGHGLGYGAGSAWAAHLQGSPRRTFVLLSDAELNTGSTWEAIQFAAHHRLGNLTLVVDANGSQAFGRTAEVLDMEPLLPKFRAFGWDAAELDGHDESALISHLRTAGAPDGPPRAVVARTVLGKGVSFMENQLDWHYLPLTEELHQRADAEVKGRLT